MIYLKQISVLIFQNDEETKILYYNYVVSTEAPINGKINHHLERLLHNLDSNFKIPSPDEMSSEALFKKAVKKAAQDKAVEKIIPCLILQSKHFNDDFFVVILGLNKFLKYIFIAAKMFQEPDPDFKENFNEFCKNSVVNASKRFRVKTVSLIMDFDPKIESLVTFAGLDEAYNYIRTKNFQLFLESMHKESSFDYDYIISHPQQVADYVARLEKFNQECVNNKLSLAEAVQNFLVTISNGDWDSNLKTDEIVRNFFDATFIGCNYTDRRFKLKILNNVVMSPYRYLNNIMYNFSFLLPSKMCDEYGWFINEKRSFMTLLNMKEIYPPEIFWPKAKLDVENIVEFAIDLCKVPAFCPTVDLNKLKTILQAENLNQDFSHYKIDMFLKNY